MKQLSEYINTNESPENPNNKYPNVKELGIGNFNGILWGHCFLYENNKYYSEIGWKNAFPSYCNMQIDETQAMPIQIDNYQRINLTKLFN